MVIKLSIPSDIHLLVETGQSISIGDSLVEEATTEDITLTLSKHLGIKPQDIFQYCSVIVGDTVAPGDIIAQKKGLLGSKKVKAEHGGRVKHIDHTTGTITLSMKSETTQKILSCVTGEIQDINIDEGTLSIDIGPADSISATGSLDCGGRRVYLTSKDVFACDEDDIRDGCVFIHTTMTHISSKMEALGAQCIMSVDGPEPEIPSIRINEKDEEKISQSSYSHVVYSVHDKQAYLYSPKK